MNSNPENWFATRPALKHVLIGLLLATSDLLLVAAAVPVQPSNAQLAVTSGYIVRPGTGFSGPTAQPASVGTPGVDGYEAKAIARWDVVPFQTFSNYFFIGVVAFHREGINRVEFSANGGAWVAVSQTSINPLTQVTEYNAVLKASDFPDGLLEVRAVAYPNIGVPRVLAGALNSTAASENGEHSMYLTANSGGSLKGAVRYVSTSGSDSNDGLTPQTAKATSNAAAFSITQAQGNSDGGIIYLLPGAHTLTTALFNTNSNTNFRWMTVTSAPGSSAADVSIVGSTGSVFNSKLVKFENVSIAGVIASGGPLEDYVWFDNVRFLGPGQDIGSVGPSNAWTGRYVTSSSASDVSDALTSYRIVRSASLDRIGADSFSNSGLVVNSSTKNVDPLSKEGTYHPDIYQHVGNAQNVILYNVKADENIATSKGVQGLQFNNPPVDIAVVGCQLRGNFLLGYAYTNVFIKDSKTTPIISNGFIAKDFVFQNSSYYGAAPGAWPGVTYR
jgi:hypothetical protein